MCENYPKEASTLVKELQFEYRIQLLSAKADSLRHKGT